MRCGLERLGCGVYCWAVQPAPQRLPRSRRMVGMMGLFVFFAGVLFVAILLGLFVWQAVREWKGRGDDK